MSDSITKCVKDMLIYMGAEKYLEYADRAAVHTIIERLKNNQSKAEIQSLQSQLEQVTRDRDERCEVKQLSEDFITVNGVAFICHELYEKEKKFTKDKLKKANDNTEILYNRNSISIEKWKETIKKLKEAEQKLVRAREILNEIASCESKIEGDVVWIAQQALKELEG